MARNRTLIKNEMTSNFMSNEVLASYYNFPVNASFEAQFSIYSLENILFNIVAFSIYLLELLFDKHREEVTELLYNQKSGRAPWYRFKALAFQYGHDLIADQDIYNNDGFTDEQIEDSKIIKYSAVTESEDESRVIIKIAGITDEELSPLPPEQIESVIAYFQEIRYAGVQLTIINYLPDELYLNLRIYRDPLVIDANGMSILDGNYPVIDAIQEFMRELPFNGEFIIQSFVDKLQGVSGVHIAHVISVNTAFIDPIANDYGVPQNVDVKTIPESGYFKFIDPTVQGSLSNIEYVV